MDIISFPADGTLPGNQNYALIKLEHPPSPLSSNAGHLTISCAQGVGNLTRRPSQGGEFDFCLGGVGKIELEVSGFK